MTDKTPDELLLTYALSEVARKQKRFLLGVCLVAAFLSITKSVPTKLTALGIELSTSNQYIFRWGMLLVVAYALFSFIIYAYSDYVAHSTALKKSIDTFTERRPLPRSYKVRCLTQVLDLWLPIILGLLTLLLLLLCAVLSDPRSVPFGD